MPSAPKATGAVLPMSASFAASNGRKPRPIISAPLIATGVPNPAAPSMNAPKLKAINSCLDTPVARDAGQLSLQYGELARFHAEIVDEDGV